MTEQVPASAVGPGSRLGLRQGGRALAGLGLNLFTGFVGLFFLLMAGIGLVTAIAGVGLPILYEALLGIRRLTRLQRRWAGQLSGRPLASPYVGGLDRGMFASLRAAALDPATWRDIGWLALQPLVALALGLVPLALLISAYSIFDSAMGNGPAQDMLGLVLISALVAATWWLLPWLTAAQCAFSRWLLSPSSRTELTERVSQLFASRADAVDAQSVELRRIERDLHDGAQARLVALAMDLGLAEKAIDENPAIAKQLVSASRASAQQALADLRGLVRGIHPPVLADRGLAGAIEAAALLCPVPIRLDIIIPARPEPPVESALYFAAAEALTNLAKHSDATRGWIRLRYLDGALRLVIGDDGRGGAALQPAGTDDSGGLAGIGRRLAAFDGRLEVVSPVGGPTEVIMELPCASSSPKT
ncbi:sensor histidine kinase [Fodinicola feengrottensis]|uniref:histidine kinase n=1 Tax=Fodinicola feengrottensis TaxID=435914 RepID=A0ABP4UIW5_9ACTN|nr:sensor histidine kinase [Fodinicola feengrottensis]